MLPKYFKQILVISVVAMLISINLSLAANTGFVATSGTKFVLNGSPFYFAGTNTYYLMVYAADAGLRSYVDEVLEEASAMDLRIVRTWAFNDGADEWNALQTAPGVYDEDVFKGLDYVLAKADDLGIRLILPFVNNWDDYGGMNQYVEWDASATSHDDFYTDSDIKGWYKNHISTVLNRVNTINGRTYKNDPTVFAWELANEPRCQSDTSGDTLNNWISEMSVYIKSIDSNHLVTTGIEGFYDEDSGPWWRNGSKGTDFIRNHQVSDIDFATAHSWPDHWGWNYNDTMSWVETQILDAHNTIGKPFILEEFGKSRDNGGVTTTRDQFFQGYYDLIYSYQAGGSNFWILYHDAYPDYDGFGVYYPADTSTIAIIESAASKENSLAVELSDFTAITEADGVVLKWTTQTEIDHFGWHIYRSQSPSGPYDKITSHLVEGAGNSAMPINYQYIDKGVEEDETYFYYLEALDILGQKSRSFIIQVTSQLPSQQPSNILLPARFELFQNYPNPFNPETWIPYQLAKDTKVTIEIYNVKGQLIRILDLGHKTSGFYMSKERATYWNGRNQTGEPVASGVYFYTLQADEFRATRRMLIIK